MWNRCRGSPREQTGRSWHQSCASFVLHAAQQCAHHILCSSFVFFFLRKDMRRFRGGLGRCHVTVSDIHAQDQIPSIQTSTQKFRFCLLLSKNKVINQTPCYATSILYR